MSDLMATIDGAAPEPKPDFEIRIDFKDDGSAARIFAIASELIAGFENLDRVLLSSVDSRIETKLVLEDVDKCCLRVILRNLLLSVDDDALKEGNWRKLVGMYLYKAKYVALEWTDQHIEEDDNPHIEDLTKRIQRLAEDTDVRHLPDYPEIKPSRLAQSLDAIQRTKAKFKPGEGLTITLGGDSYRVNLEERWLPSDHLPPEENQQLENDQDMVLMVRRPDLLGKAQWTFKHGTRNLQAPISDQAWLDRFHRRDEVVSPGDALRVRVRFEHKYGERGELAEEKAEILKVYGVIKAPPGQTGLFSDD